MCKSIFLLSIIHLLFIHELFHGTNHIQFNIMISLKYPVDENNWNFNFFIIKVTIRDINEYRLIFH